MSKYHSILDKDLRIQLEQENRSQPGSEGDLQR